ncbi:hypothetical protein PIB30_093324 [Stylosanthes scabra]|uniref:Uncharacterized protein n=1 Tax=Stylosanthes scabra TaxID=79078 RepID=A0ABU6UUK5_9FABA|nr:hypothetical protein [Stylosanthes scabra]
MASKGKAPAKASSTRVYGSTSQQQSPLEIQLYETPAHEERGKILEERRALHEHTIKFPKGEDTFEERILARGWGFMYEPSIPINLSWVWEFYANKTKKDQREIFLRRRKITCSEYAGSSCFDHEICHECRSYQDKDSPSHISHVHHQMGPRQQCSKIPGDVIVKIPKSQQFFPYLKWREDDEEVAPPVPPPAAPVDVPAPSAPSSPEYSRKDLMRALRRNERIMRRHEQLMLMLHPGLDTSGLEQISSPEISQNLQNQKAGSAEKGNTEEDDDFQSAEVTGDASTYAGEESADDK